MDIHEFHKKTIALLSSDVPLRGLRDFFKGRTGGMYVIEMPITEIEELAGCKCEFGDKYRDFIWIYKESDPRPVLQKTSELSLLGMDPFLRCQMVRIRTTVF